MVPASSRPRSEDRALEKARYISSARDHQPNIQKRRWRRLALYPGSPSVRRPQMQNPNSLALLTMASAAKVFGAALALQGLCEANQILSQGRDMRR